MKLLLRFENEKVQYLKWDEKDLEAKMCLKKIQEENGKRKKS